MKRILILLLILVMMFTGCSASITDMPDAKAESGDVFSQIEATVALTSAAVPSKSRAVLLMQPAI